MESINIGYLIVGSIIWLIIMYYLISSAVRAGNKKQMFLLKMQNRMLMKRMIKEGFTVDEIEELHKDEYNDYYWHSLKKEEKKH